MNSPSEKPLLIVIAGPTAVGKTSFAIELSKALGAPILSADSRQFYRELNIGTAKPSVTELSEAQHYFINSLSISDYYNISYYEQEALELLGKLFIVNPLAILVGGSGLYIDALCRGVDNFPDPDPDLRKFLKGIYQDEGIGALRRLLSLYDPEYYNEVDLANPNRILRALEVCMTTGKPYSQQRINKIPARAFSILKIGLNLPRPELFEKINIRVDQMIEAGLVEEVRSFLEYRHLNALNTVGYKELFSYFDGECSLEQAVIDIKTNTRRYAKRQLTWFKKDAEYEWIHPNAVQEFIARIHSGRKK